MSSGAPVSGKLVAMFGHEAEHGRGRRRGIAVADADLDLGAEGEQVEQVCAAAGLERVPLVGCSNWLSVNEKREAVFITRSASTWLTATSRSRTTSAPRQPHAEGRRIEIAVVPREVDQFHSGSRSVAARASRRRRSRADRRGRWRLGDAHPFVRVVVFARGDQPEALAADDDAALGLVGGFAARVLDQLPQRAVLLERSPTASRAPARRPGGTW